MKKSGGKVSGRDSSGHADIAPWPESQTIQEPIRLMLSGNGLCHKLNSWQTIGTDEKLSRIVLENNEPNSYVSGRHCTITRIGAEYFLEDAGSQNGTYLNGRRIGLGRQIKLEPGDELMLANVKFKVEALNEE
ncbi:MAG: FHA domain-containing protein [Eubacteriaceae bacterium]